MGVGGGFNGKACANCLYVERKLWCFMRAIDRTVQAFEEDIEVSTNFD